jgi:hypothetical protein
MRAILNLLGTFVGNLFKSRRRLEIGSKMWRCCYQRMKSRKSEVKAKFVHAVIAKLPELLRNT